MKGVLVSIFFIFLLFGMLLYTPVILAQDDNADENSDEDDNSKSETRVREDGREIRIEKEVRIENGKRVERIRKRIVTEDGRDVEFDLRIESRTDNGKTRERIRYEIGGREFEVEAEEEIELEEDTNGTEYKLKARLRNGNITDIKIMPDRAVEIALERLRALNFSVELKEIEDRNIPRVVYNIESNKTGRFLGIFKLRLKVAGHVNPETGEFIGISKPWWAFLVNGEDSDQTNENDIDEGDVNDEDDREVEDMDEDENETDNEITIKLLEQNSSGESGTATLEEEDGQAIVTLSMTGFQENVSQPAHIHIGSCPDVGSVVYPLENVLSGHSETTLEVTLEQLESELPLGINIHKSAEEANIYTSCGDIEF